MTSLRQNTTFEQKEQNMKTAHSIHIGASQNMVFTENNTVDLVVTSPPYPMIKMWDDVMAKQNPDIARCLDINPGEAFELMHMELDKVWKECFRVLKPGGFLCINIGDATRTINGSFCLYNNHSRVLRSCTEIGFTCLPGIIWHKQTNASNKFMGSGMLPCGAYVTLEHEWILIFRKGPKREHTTPEEKQNRMKSAFFWEERNIWFSDIWNIRGVSQTMKGPRDRSAAYPFEIPYRLINMFSQKGDMILDPFLGLGTTTQAAILLGRNSQGYEIDPGFKSIIQDNIERITPDSYNAMIDHRIETHNEFVQNRLSSGKEVKYFNKNLNCKVMTKQETDIEFDYIDNSLLDESKNKVLVMYL